MAVNAWQVSLEYNNQQMILPVNPEKIEVERSINHNTTEIVGMGEVAEAGFSQLRSVSFESFIPAAFTKNLVIPILPPYLNVNSLRPINWYDMWFNTWAQARTPARLIVTESYTINMLVLCDSYNFYHQGGDSDDIYYSMKLLAYRDYSPQLVSVNSSKGTGSTSTNRQPTIGATCIVNGRLHRDSWGNGAGQTERNARRRISHIVTDPTRQYPIHVTTLDGGWRGWVSRSAVTLV